MFDIDGDGRISKDEFNQTLINIGKALIKTAPKRDFSADKAEKDDDASAAELQARSLRPHTLVA